MHLTIASMSVFLHHNAQYARGLYSTDQAHIPHSVYGSHCATHRAQLVHQVVEMPDNGKNREVVVTWSRLSSTAAKRDGGIIGL